MKRNFLLSLGLSLILVAAALGQSGPAAVANPANGGQGQPVSYTSITQLNGLLAQLEQVVQLPWPVEHQLLRMMLVAQRLCAAVLALALATVVR